MAENEFIQAIIPVVIPWLKLGMIAFVVALIVIIGVVLILEKRKRKWRIEIHEQKADGRLHSVGFDTLIEKKLNMGTKTIYWLKKGKTETIPPPWETVDRIGRKEEADYLRVERDYIPTVKTMKVDYNDPRVKNAVARVYDNIRFRIRSVKTTLFDAEAVRDRFMYIPINKTLTAKMEFKPIDYDMNMMAMNEIHNADEFYQSKYEFWKKYGAVIVFGVTIVFLIILVVLTYDYMEATIGTIMGKVSETSGLLNNVVDKLGGAKPPS